MAVSVSYYTVRRSDRQWTFFFYLRSDGQYVLISDAIMAMFFVDYYTVWRSDRQRRFFSI